MVSLASKQKLIPVKSIKISINVYKLFVVVFLAIKISSVMIDIYSSFHGYERGTPKKQQHYLNCLKYTQKTVTMINT